MQHCPTCGTPGHGKQNCPVRELNDEQEAYQVYREYCAQRGATPMDVTHWKRHMRSIEGERIH